MQWWQRYRCVSQDDSKVCRKAEGGEAHLQTGSENGLVIINARRVGWDGEVSFGFIRRW